MIKLSLIDDVFTSNTAVPDNH